MLGAGPCGDLAALPDDGRAVVCLDLDDELLQIGRAVADGAVSVPYIRGLSEIIDAPIDVSAGLRQRLRGAEIIAGNALDPPLQASSFAVIVCLNLLDSISDPEVLLGQCQALLADSGALLLASPYAYSDAITAPERQLPHVLGNPTDLPAAVEKLVTGAWDPRFMASMRLQFVDRRVPWRLRVNDRMAVDYVSHALLLRKQGGD